jgi:hypothetical protein
MVKPIEEMKIEEQKAQKKKNRMRRKVQFKLSLDTEKTRFAGGGKPGDQIAEEFANYYNETEEEELVSDYNDDMPIMERALTVQNQVDQATESLQTDNGV